MGIKVVPRKKKIKLTPTQKAVMGSYEHGGVVKKRRKLPSGVTAPPYIPPTTKGRGALGMSGAVGGAIGSAVGGIPGAALGNIGTLARDKRAKTYSNRMRDTLRKKQFPKGNIERPTNPAVLRDTLRKKQFPKGNTE